MSNFNLTNLAVNMYCPGNAAQLDDAGLPSIMVWIPAFKLSDVLNTANDSIHPAFIVNGVQIPGFWYSKYQNVIHNGKAYSLPGEDPKANVNFDKAIEYCEAKGYGWHMSTAAEWAAIDLWCKKNGFQPYGNNNYGKDSRESEYKAIPSTTNNDGEILRVATGTGPLTWSHDNSMSGIWDMNGNVWEWQGGLRLVWGELQILENNDAADPDNPQNETSVCWKAINAADGALVEPESSVSDDAPKASGNTVKLDYVDGTWKFSTGISATTSRSMSCLFNVVSCTDAISEAVKGLLRALALLPEDGGDSNAYGADYVWWHNGASERIMYRGGNMGNSAAAGVFSVSCSDSRLNANYGIGFRASYIPNI